MWALRMQQKRFIGYPIHQWLRWRGVSIGPWSYAPEHPPYIPHIGTITIHARTVIGKNVTLFHGVTLGRGDIWDEPQPDFGGFVLEDDVILGAGAVLLSARGTLTVGQGTIVAANSVLRESTGAYEIWAGNPARRAGYIPGSGPARAALKAKKAAEAEAAGVSGAPEAPSAVNQG